MELWTAFLLGMVGSVHCAGMCGPLALALPTGSAKPIGFVAGRTAYNLGRIVTYAIIGAMVGLIGRSLLLAGVQRWVSIGLGVALLAGLLSSKQLGVARPVLIVVTQVKNRMSSLLRQRSFSALFILGLLNGLLPCGLVYVAVAAATATGSLLKGAEYMAIFGLGTAPMLIAISLSGKLLPIRFRLHVYKAVPISIFLVASMLILRGMGLGIPYLSPDLSAAGPSCCGR